MMKGTSILIFLGCFSLVLCLLGVPVSAQLDEAPLNQTNANTSGYVIHSVNLPSQTVGISTGSYISPSIVLEHTGLADTSENLIRIRLFLGEWELVSKNNQITPLHLGEIREIHPGYLVPGVIPSGEYDLIVSVDQAGEGEEPEILNTQEIQEWVKVKAGSVKSSTSGCGCT